MPVQQRLSPKVAKQGWPTTAEWLAPPLKVVMLAIGVLITFNREPTISRRTCVSFRVQLDYLGLGNYCIGSKP